MMTFGESGFSTEDLEGASDELLQQLDIGDLDAFLRDLDLPMDTSFGDLVMRLISGDGFDAGELLEFAGKLFFGQWASNQAILMQILLLVVGFAVLKNFAEVFDKSYISNVCFLLIYCLLMVLLMKSLLILNVIVGDTITTVIDFMTAFIPVFATTMILVNGDATAVGFYQMGFLIVYLLQWILGYFLVPFVKVYVIFGLLNYTLEEERFSKLTELLESAVSWVLKVLTSVVLGVSIIKNAIAPLADSFTRATLRKSLAFIPGIGSTLTAASDLFLASGSIIRNGVGMAAVVVLVLLCLTPLVKIGCMTFLYRVLAALVEPLADRRVSGAMQVVAKGGGLLFRILTTCVVMIFITVAMTTLLGQKMM